MTHAKRLIIKKISLSYFVKNESKYTKMHLSKLYNANTKKIHMNNRLISVRFFFYTSFYFRKLVLLLNDSNAIPESELFAIFLKPELNFSWLLLVHINKGKLGMIYLFNQNLALNIP